MTINLKFYGYAIVDKNNDPVWNEKCVSQDKEVLEDTLEDLDIDHKLQPCRVVRLSILPSDYYVQEEKIKALEKELAWFKQALNYYPSLNVYAALKGIVREAIKADSDNLDRAIDYAKDIGALDVLK